MKRVSLLAVLMLVNCFLYAQPAIEWQATFGGSDFDIATSIQATADGGMVMAGTTFSNDGDASAPHGIDDILVIKLRADKTVQWKRTFGGSNADGAHEIQVTSDGGYIIAGYSKSTNGDVMINKGASDYWILKLNANGNIEWQQTYGGRRNDVASSVKELPGGGYIVAGYTMSNDGDVTNNHFDDRQDAWIVKLNAQGNILWQRCYGGSDNDFAYHIALTGRGYIFSGYAKSMDGDPGKNSGLMDAWIVKLDAVGNMVWQKVMGGTRNESAHQVKAVPGGGYIIAGVTTSADGDISLNKGGSDSWIIQLLEDGSVAWSRTFGGTSLEAARSVLVSPAGEFIITGSAESNDQDVTHLHGRSDYWVIALNASGNLLWQKNYGGTDIDDAMASCFTSNGQLVIAGASFSKDMDVAAWKDAGDIWIIQLNVFPSPVIITQPADTSICLGNIALLTIAGNDITTYQWQLANGTNWIDLTDDAVYTGTTTATLQMLHTNGTNSFRYRCKVSNAHTQVTSATATVIIQTAPVIIQSPALFTACTGSNATLTVRALHAQSYQWQVSRNGNSWQNISNSDTPNISVTISEGAIQYRCITSNVCGQSTSASASITSRNCQVPNAFSPNGDGINDTWVIPFLSTETNVRVSVFDRYGSIVLQSNGRYQPWTGQLHNQPLPVGVYYYIINLQNEKKPLSGSITLLR